MVLPLTSARYVPYVLPSFTSLRAIPATIILILAPQPSVIRILVYHHWRVLQQPRWLFIHALGIPSLTLLALTSLTVCVTRNPGPVNVHRNEAARRDSRDDVGIAEALMGSADDEYLMTPGKWCRKCWAPKPERAHHCSVCGRCVMKLDHHCPWLASSCIVCRLCLRIGG